MSNTIVRQHLIDPELCICCNNTCEDTCPAGAITHDYRNYAVDAQRCNGCMDCVAPCPTVAIDTQPFLRRRAIGGSQTFAQTIVAR